MTMSLADDYFAQLERKEQILRNLLAPFTTTAPQVYESPPQHFRMRSEFRIWHKQGELRYAMFTADKKPIFLNQFDQASEDINRLMRELGLLFLHHDEIRKRLFQVNFLTTRLHEALITLCYHKTLDEHWLVQAKAIANKLGCKLVGRAKKQKWLTDDDQVREHFQVAGINYDYLQPEGAFTQPNAFINQHMLEWVSAHLALIGGDLLELYCGIGNFTLPASRQVKQVFATEINSRSIKALQDNLALNQIHNVRFARLSAEEMTQALAGVRPFRRLQEIDLSHYDFQTILLDPPRAGLDNATCHLASQFKHILYISCNPHSLVANLNYLSKTHKIVKVALFDQFPFTPHIECGVWLKKKRTLFTFE